MTEPEGQSPMDPDEDLRRRFAELRRLDATDAPDVEALVRAPRRRVSVLRAVGAAMPALAAAAALLVWCTRPPMAEAPTSAVAPMSNAAPAMAGEAAGGQASTSPAPAARPEPLPLDFLLDHPAGLALSLPADLDPPLSAAP